MTFSKKTKERCVHCQCFLNFKKHRPGCPDEKFVHSGSISENVVSRDDVAKVVAASSLQDTTPHKIDSIEVDLLEKRADVTSIESIKEPLARFSTPISSNTLRSKSTVSVPSNNSCIFGKLNQSSRYLKNSACKISVGKQAVSCCAYFFYYVMLGIVFTSELIDKTVENGTKLHSSILQEKNISLDKPEHLNNQKIMDIEYSEQHYKFQTFDAVQSIDSAIKVQNFLLMRFGDNFNGIVKHREDFILYSSHGSGKNCAAAVRSFSTLTDLKKFIKKRCEYTCPISYVPIKLIPIESKSLDCKQNSYQSTLKNIGKITPKKIVDFKKQASSSPPLCSKSLAFVELLPERTIIAASISQFTPGVHIKHVPYNTNHSCQGNALAFLFTLEKANDISNKENVNYVLKQGFLAYEKMAINFAPNERNPLLPCLADEIIQLRLDGEIYRCVRSGKSDLFHPDIKPCKGPQELVGAIIDLLSENENILVNIDGNVSTIKVKNGVYYFFDSHANNPKTGMKSRFSEEGFAICIKMSSLIELKKYLEERYADSNLQETRIDLDAMIFHKNKRKHKTDPMLVFDGGECDLFALERRTLKGFVTKTLIGIRNPISGHEVPVGCSPPETYLPLKKRRSVMPSSSPTAGLPGVSCRSPARKKIKLSNPSEQDSSTLVSNDSKVSVLC